MLTVFNRCRLTAVDHDREVFALRRALAEEKIPCRVRVEEQFCNSHNRGAGMAALAGEKYKYIFFVRKQDLARACAVMERAIKSE